MVTSFRNRRARVGGRRHYGKFWSTIKKSLFNFLVSLPEYAIPPLQWQMLGQTDAALLAPTVDIWSSAEQYQAFAPECRDCNRSMLPKSFNGVKRFDVDSTRLVLDRYYPRELLASRYYCATNGCGRSMTTTSPHYLLTLPAKILSRIPPEVRHRSAVTPRLRDEILCHLLKANSVRQ